MITSKQWVRGAMLAVIAAANLPMAFAQTAQPAVSALRIASRAPQLQTVTATSSAGRPTKFQDASGREYQCAYDDHGRPLMVESRDELNSVRRTLLGYDSSNRLRIAQFPSGYVVFIDYAANGAQMARDSRGNRIALASSAEPQGLNGAAADQQEQLRTAAQSTLALVDALRTGT